MSHIAMRPVTTQKVTSSGSSAQSSAFGSNVEYVRVIGDADCHIEFGVNPTAANRVEEGGSIEMITDGASSNTIKLVVTFVIRR